MLAQLLHFEVLLISQAIPSRPQVGGVPIQQIWVVRDSGLCLYQSSFEKEKTERIDNTLFPGFITAIQTFSEEMTKKPIRKIQMGDLIINQYKRNDLLACISTKEEITDEFALEELFHKILDEFEAEYRSILERSEVFDMEDFSTFHTKILHLFNVNLAVTISESKITPSLNLMFKVLGKNSDKVITSVVRGDKLAVIGDKGQTEIIIATLERFTPHRALKVRYWTEDILMGSYDIIGIPKSLEKYFSKEGWSIFDLEAGKYKVSANRFISKLVKDIKALDDQKSRDYLIETRLHYFTSRVGTILDLYQREEVSKKALELLRKDIDKALFELIVSYITNTIDSTITENPLFASKTSAWRKLDAF